MSYCKNCGAKLMDGAKFCQKCGYSLKKEGSENAKRQFEYAGKMYKCPNCGEILKSFEINCPSCGHELRGVKATNAVKEFALKLEAIEARREYEKPHRFLTTGSIERISKTDEQKISLIKSFSVPNTKEDMLEFMILATSSINMSIYDSTHTRLKSEKELNAAWLAKVQQVYEKAQRSYSADDTFIEIKRLYDKCNEDIKNSKKKSIIKWCCMVGWIPVVIIIACIFGKIDSSKSEKEEIARLESIVTEIEEQLENEEYKYALMNAEGLVYDSGYENEELERQWEIEREYWIDTIIDDAAENGITLERPVENEETGETTTSSTTDSEGGVVSGFRDGLESGLESAQDNIDEYNSIMNDHE